MKRPDDRQAMSDDTVDARLALEAMSYVLCELSPADVEAFERRLIDDQAAGEAVVEAVRLCQAVTGLSCNEDFFHASSTVSKPISARSDADRFVAWGAVALAASVMLAVVVAGLGRAPSMVASGNLDPQARLALAWANTPSVSDTSEEETGETSTTDDDDDGTIVDKSTDTEDVTGTSGFLPTDDGNWLLEALTDLQQRPGVFARRARTPLRGDGSPPIGPVIRGET